MLTPRSKSTTRCDPQRSEPLRAVSPFVAVFSTTFLRTFLESPLRISRKAHQQFTYPASGYKIGHTYDASALIIEVVLRDLTTSRFDLVNLDLGHSKPACLPNRGYFGGRGFRSPIQSGRHRPQRCRQTDPKAGEVAVLDQNRAGDSAI